MWNYNYTDELYHYGVKGMKWGVRKKRGITGLIRDRQRANDLKALNENQRKQRQVSSELKELRGYEKNPSRIGKSKISTAIRRSQIKSLEKTHSKLKSEEKTHRDALKELDSIEKYQQEKRAAKEKYKQTDEYKAKRAKAIKVGVAVAGTALAAYGAYKVNKHLNTAIGKEYRKQGKQWLEQAKSDNIAAEIDLTRARALRNMNMPSYNASMRSYRYKQRSNEYYDRAGEALLKARQRSYSLGEKVNYVKEQYRKRRH